MRVAASATGEAQSQAGAASRGRAGVQPVSGEVFRSKRAALSREVGKPASDSLELHLGKEGPARSGPGAQGRPARGASTQAGAPPLPGVLLHIDGSRHHWFQDDRWYDLRVILDDATSRIYYAQLVEEESTMTVSGALRKVVEQEGIFCALYSDRASQFFWTLRAGGKVDPEQMTQVGRASRELGIRMTPAYSPQARSGRGFGTWQGRLPQELRLRGMGTLEQANAFLEQEYTAEFNQRFQVPAFQAGSAFLPCQRKDLDVLFSVQQVRVVSRENTVVVGGKTLQIEATRWRGTLAGCSVTVCEHSDLSWSIRYGPHAVGRYNAQGWPCQRRSETGGGRLWKRRSVEKSFGLSHRVWESRPNRGIPLSHSHRGAALATSNRTYRVL
jgi:hypothetical protein